jgi:23S rRNA (uridine2552-2'-O)-methyltransferase
MSRTKSSRRWLDRQFSDPYVKRAQEQGYRSRAAYKLLEIQEKDRLIRPGMRILDLGAAPGAGPRSPPGWRVPGGGSRLDLLAMEPIPGVTLLQGDFREESVLAELRTALRDPVSTSSSPTWRPNLSGAAAVDQPRSLYLAELALDLAREVLKPGGDLVVKIFQGEGFDRYLRELRGSFHRVASRKPKASRPESRELYLVAKGFRGNRALEAPAHDRRWTGDWGAKGLARTGSAFFTPPIVLISHH